jgi:hypothetical protein
MSAGETAENQPDLLKSPDFRGYRPAADTRTLTASANATGASAEASCEGGSVRSTVKFKSLYRVKT